MKRRDWLEKWGLSSLKLNVGFATGEFNPHDPDRAAAWDLYVELLPRITTQHLPPEDGDEKTALDSVHALFPLTREILRKHGSGYGEPSGSRSTTRRIPRRLLLRQHQFAELAIPVLKPTIAPRQMAPALARGRFSSAKYPSR